MTDAEIRRLRRAGLTIAGGGVLLGGLSFVVPAVFLAGALLLAAVLVQFEGPSGGDVLNIGFTLGLFGALLFAHAAAGIGPFDAFVIAAALVLGGVFELAFAPWLAKYAPTE